MLLKNYTQNVYVMKVTHPNIKIDIIIFEYIIDNKYSNQDQKYHMQILPINIEAFINDFRRRNQI